MHSFVLEGPGGIPGLKQLGPNDTASSAKSYSWSGSHTFSGSVALSGAVTHSGAETFSSTVNLNGTVNVNGTAAAITNGSFAVGDNGVGISGALAGIDTAFSHVLRIYNNFTTGNTQIVTPNGVTQFYSGGTETLDVNNGNIGVNSGTAIAAGGALMAKMTTSNIGIYVGSGAPSASAPQGSIYLRSDGSSTSTRAYINTNGTTGWAAITTAS